MVWLGSTTGTDIGGKRWQAEQAVSIARRRQQVHAVAGAAVSKARDNSIRRDPRAVCRVEMLQNTVKGPRWTPRHTGEVFCR
jgi:hypothetical protein